MQNCICNTEQKSLEMADCNVLKTEIKQQMPKFDKVTHENFGTFA